MVTISFGLGMTTLAFFQNSASVAWTSGSDAIPLPGCPTLPAPFAGGWALATTTTPICSRLRAFWFADLQVHVLGHHYIAGNVTAIPNADSLTRSLEGLFLFGRQTIEQRHPVIATKRDEMQAALVLIADWFDMHSR